MAELKPSIRAIDICHHGNEIAVVLDGENLWFCHQVTVGGHHELLPAQKATAVSIRFNTPRKEGAINVVSGKVKISLQSHFSRPAKDSFVANIEVSVMSFIKSKVITELVNGCHIHVCDFLSTPSQEYNITTRQQQLAKLTPSALIEMAYLCALLEQHPFSKSKPLSHKFEVVRLFLEDVVHVVPFESILYAIANCGLDTAMSCFQALKSYQLDLPISELMDEGLNLAVIEANMWTGH